MSGTCNKCEALWLMGGTGLCAECADDARIAALEAENARLLADLAAEREKTAALAAALEKLKRNALEMAGYVKSYGLDDAGPQSEWSRWSQCRSNIENESDPTAILASVRAAARREGAVEALKELAVAWESYAAVTDSINLKLAALKGGA